MSELNAFGYTFVLILGAQGLAMVVAPDRVLAWTMAKYRFFGARPAEPGRGTVILYRIGGIAMLVAAVILLIQFLSE